MDLIFKRYSSPFFLDYCVENGELNNLYDFLLEKRDEDMLWEMYLATLPHNDMSFINWKKSLEKQVQAKTQQVVKMSKREIDATIKKSEEILRGFKPPPQKGGT